jgi:hypothetical protein
VVELVGFPLPSLGVEPLRLPLICRLLPQSLTFQALRLAQGRALGALLRDALTLHLPLKLGEKPTTS